jgi:shikimate dehydrogenase
MAGRAFALAGHPQSLARALRIPGRYVLFRVPPEKLEAAVRGIATLGLRGCNVTTPHKQAIFPLLDRVDDLARRSARSTPSSWRRTAR